LSLLRGEITKQNLKNWDLIVPAIQLAINNRIHSVTKSTPFSLMFGRNLNLFKDYSIEEIGGEIQSKEIQEK
jgi:hypothetical protein